MKDVQNDKPNYPIQIDEVGIVGLKYPIKVLEKNNGYISTVADIKIYVSLPDNKRGTHMSRFVEVVEKHKNKINGKILIDILRETKNYFDAENVGIEVTFPYFIKKRSPVSNKKSMMYYICGFDYQIKDGKEIKKVMVRVPVTTLCPCSKAISDRGAHNQRAYITLKVDTDEFIWFEDLIEIVEGSASAPIYPLLKRIDEKYVTELAYDNPRFVEDVVREVYTKVKKSFNIKSIEVLAESEESIHFHLAYARVVG